MTHPVPSALRTVRSSAESLPTVAMIGGGQLARMTQQAAIALGVKFSVLAEKTDDPAAQVSVLTTFGSHTNLESLLEVAEGAHAVTFDHEHVPLEHLKVLESQGIPVYPPAAALQFAQNKLAMRKKLSTLGVLQPEYLALNTRDAREELSEFSQRKPLVLKTIQGGYDGRGVWLPDSAAEVLAIFDENYAAGVELMAEERVEMVRELSAMVARSPFGQGAVWPVVETVQRDGQCAVVLAPAPNLSAERAQAAQALALQLANELSVVGVMAVELFETAQGFVVNELAMRPHNSGHWSMDGAVTGQFEQHLRAVLDYPLGETTARAPLTVMANVLGAQEAPTMTMDERLHHLFARYPAVKVHLYGKAERPDRKIGHVNMVGNVTSDSPVAGNGEGGDLYDQSYVKKIRDIAELSAHYLSHAEWSDGYGSH